MVDWLVASAIAVCVTFTVFWGQSGWYRVDCALGIQQACEKIRQEKDYQGK